MDEQPGEPGDEAREPQRADECHASPAADRRERALVAVAEGRERLAAERARHVRPGVRAHLDRRRRDARDRLAVLLQGREVADHEHATGGRARSGPARRARGPRGRARRRASARAATPGRRRPRRSCAPRGGRRRPLRTPRRCRSLPSRSRPARRAPRAAPAPAREVLRVGVQHARPRLDQHHARARAGRCGGSRAPASGARSRRRPRPSRPRSARRRSREGQPLPAGARRLPRARPARRRRARAAGSRARPRSS